MSCAGVTTTPKPPSQTQVKHRHYRGILHQQARTCPALFDESSFELMVFVCASTWIIDWIWRTPPYHWISSGCCSHCSRTQGGDWWLSKWHREQFLTSIVDWLTFEVCFYARIIPMILSARVRGGHLNFNSLVIVSIQVTPNWEMNKQTCWSTCSAGSDCKKLRTWGKSSLVSAPMSIQVLTPKRGLYVIPPKIQTGQSVLYQIV